MTATQGFDVLVNGIARSFRDLATNAHAAALVLKTRWPI